MWVLGVLDVCAMHSVKYVYKKTTSDELMAFVLKIIFSNYFQNKKTVLFLN